jgi:hypothetical protein
MTEFTNVSEKTVLDGTELMLGASSTDETIAQKYSVAAINRHNGFLNVKDYGAVGDGISGGTDDTVAIRACIADAKAWRKGVYFPSEGADGTSYAGYKTTDTIHFPNYVSVIMEIGIICTDATVPIITIGEVTGSNNQNAFTSGIYDLTCSYWTNHGGEWSYYGAWELDTSVCIEVHALAKCGQFNVRHTRGGHCGVRFVAEDAMGYNTINIGFIDYAHKAVEIRVDTSPFDSAGGWFNENTINLGAVRSEGPPHYDMGSPWDRFVYYVKDDGVDPTPSQVDGNVFNGGSYELGSDDGGKRYFIHMNNLKNNTFQHMRIEAHDGQFFGEVGASQGCYNNLFRVLRTHQAVLDDPLVLDWLPGSSGSSSTMGNIVQLQTDPGGYNTIWDSGFLPDKVTPHSLGYTLEGMAWHSESSVRYAGDVGGPLLVFPTHIQTVDNDVSPMIQVNIPDIATKQLRISVETPGANRGRIHCMVFDKDGNQLTDGTDLNIPRACSLPAQRNAYGTAWRDDGSVAQTTHQVEFRTTNSYGAPPIAYIWLVFTHGGELSRIKIAAHSNQRNASVDSPISRLWEEKGRASDIVPNSGIWKIGECVRNLNPTAGGWSGWRCITAGDFAGTPPVFKRYGALEV